MKKILANRRGFIKKLGISASSLICAPHIIPSSAWGKNKTRPPSDRITIGHIAAGGRGSSLLQSFLELEDAQSLAVCDPFSERRTFWAEYVDKYYAEKNGRSSSKGCSVYNDFRELLARDDIDAVVIATPDHWHVPITVAAANAGKDMYVEKPLGVSIFENQTAQKAVRRNGRIFQYGTQQRSNRNFRFACELTRNRHIGELHTIHAWCADISSQAHFFNEPGGSTKPVAIPDGFDYNLWLGPALWSPYTSDRCTSFGTYHKYDNSLGFIAGWGAHPLDIAQWGNNTDRTAPIEYFGTGTIADKGLYDTVSSWDMWCLYEKGVKMRFMSTEIARPIVEKYHPRFRDHGTTFIGTEGWVSVDRSNIYASSDFLLRLKLRPVDIHLTDSRNHQQNFVDGVRKRIDPISPVEAAVQSDIISHLCDISIRLNRKIRWNPESEVIVGDQRANRMLIRSMRSPWSLGTM